MTETRITVEGRAVAVQKGITVMEGLVAAGLFLRSDCGGRGRCGKCQVRVSSGNPVVVFNVCGNTYRLICAIHYDTGKVFLLRFLTHAEYSKSRWKDEL